MPAIGRVHRPGTDFALNSHHGCSGCKSCNRHSVRGPAVTGSGTVFINGAPAVRVGDRGVHDKGTCCGSNQWLALRSVSNTNVFINGALAFCDGDITLHDDHDTGVFRVTQSNVGASSGGGE